ncbi:MAG: hypothetical protein Salg2KO_15850 [Salibacteraceae bacterium]
MSFGFILDVFITLIPVFWVISLISGIITTILQRNPRFSVLILLVFTVLFTRLNANIRFHPSDQNTSLNIASLNVGQFSNDTNQVQSIINQLNERQPDIIALQEFGLYYKWPNTQSVVRDFAEKVDMPYYHFKPQKDNIFGVAVFSRYPIIMAEKLFEKAGPTNEAVRYTIGLNGQLLDLINVHLQSYNFSHLGNVVGYVSPDQVWQQQRMQALRILDNLRVEENTIVVGDLNAPAGTQPYNTLSRIGDDMLQAAGIGWSPTVDLMPLRIDHGFASNDIHVLSVDVVATQSDHHLLVFDIAL